MCDIYSKERFEDKLRRDFGSALREAKMADRKGQSVTFKVPHGMNLRDLKIGLESEITSDIVVFQDLGGGEYLVEFSSVSDAEALVEEGFDVSELHVSCHPPHAQSINVSIMGLRSYIEDKEVRKVLSQYGEIKGDVIRLKYRDDHELAGLENGNRLVRMLLTEKSIPYSLRIGGEWCRIIHNNQQPVCGECKELAHTRKRCPQIECRICKEKGHLSYVCDKRVIQAEEPRKQEDQVVEVVPLSPAKTSSDNDAVNVKGSNDDEGNIVQQESNETAKDTVDTLEAMDTEHAVQGCKRQISDSDSDEKTQHRRARIHPVPNLGAGKQRDKNAATSAAKKAHNDNVP